MLMNASNVEQWATEQVRGEGCLLFWINLQQIECAFLFNLPSFSAFSQHAKFAH